MNELFLSKYYYEYKEGFANGIVDFIINVNSGLYDYEELRNNCFWNVGYNDANNYYRIQFYRDGITQLNLSNIADIITEFFWIRLSEYNEISGDLVPAFTLVLGQFRYGKY
ncbi:MAG: hypothetical protein IKF19_04020 [Bacilli bacterium]|nr:hypothetical protein [Bacilli bacterium]